MWPFDTTTHVADQPVWETVQAQMGLSLEVIVLVAFGLIVAALLLVDLAKKGVWYIVSNWWKFLLGLAVSMVNFATTKEYAREFLFNLTKPQ